MSFKTRASRFLVLAALLGGAVGCDVSVRDRSAPAPRGVNVDVDLPPRDGKKGVDVDVDVRPGGGVDVDVKRNP